MLLSQKTQAALCQIWEAFSADGIPPHLATLQMSLLILLKLLDERTEARCHFHEAELPETIHWRFLKMLTGEACLEHLAGPVAAWLRTCVPASTMPVLAQATLTISKAHILESVMELIDELFAPSRPPALHAAIYEALLSKAEQAAAVWAQPAGQFLTPMHIARLLCDLVRPQSDETIADLACGNGRLLLAAYQHVWQAEGKQDTTRLFCPDGSVIAALGACETQERGEGAPPVRFFGVDRDAEMAWQAWMHLFCAGVSAPAIHVADTLSKGFQQYLEENGPFDVVLANPPYGSTVDQGDLADSLRRLGTRHAEVLFLELIIQQLRPGGRAAVIVPDGLLFGQGRAFGALRRRLLDVCTLHAVVSLPQGVFLPYTGVKTSILVFSRGGPTTNVWFYTLEKEGTTLNSRRLPRPEQTDLPDLLVKYGLRSGGRPAAAFVNEQTWFCWENVEPALRSQHYTRPLTVNCYVLDDAGCPTKITVCHGAMAVPMDVPKDWSVAVSDLDEGVNLGMGCYAPLTVPALGRSQRKVSSSSAQGARNEDEMPDIPGCGSRHGKPRACEGLLAEVFRLPELRDEDSLQAWFDQSVKQLFGLRDEGLLTKYDLRQLIELLLEVQRIQATHDGSKAQTSGPAANITVQEASEQLVLVPLALEWTMAEETPGWSIPAGTGRERTPRRKSDLVQQRFLLGEDGEMCHQ